MQQGVWQTLSMQRSARHNRRSGMACLLGSLRVLEAEVMHAQPDTPLKEETICKRTVPY